MFNAWEGLKNKSSQKLDTETEVKYKHNMHAVT